MSTLAIAERQTDILAALRGLKGTATVGDVVAATGLAEADTEAALKALLETHRGHLAVSDSGELLYRFDRRLIQRGTEPLAARLSRAARDLLTRVFKATIVVMLVAYFVIFLVLVIAAIFAQERGGGRRRGGWGRGGHRGHGLPIGNMWLWYWIWGPRWRLGRPYYGHRWERTLPKDDKVPFYKKVFAFVFGPDRPEPTRRQLDRSMLRLIRARAGVLSAAELVGHTALPLEEAEEEIGRLVGAYGGEPVVSPNGELAYAFPTLMTSAHGRVDAREPNPAWMRLEYPRELTGNTAGANAIVTGMNGFTLLASATAPWFVFPRLGIGGTAAFVWLVLVPVVYSLLFFALPGLRMLGVRRENRRRARRNVRRVVLGLVFERSLRPDPLPVTVSDAFEHAKSRLSGHQAVGRDEVETALHDLAGEFDAEVEPGEAGEIRFRFPSLRSEVAASEATRRRLRLDTREVGPIVFDTGDSTAQEDARALAAFDRELEGADLRRYAPAPDRVGFEAEYELVAFDEELAGRRLAVG
ncbi:MAG TPA: hypothetical protein VK849_08280 [Longimicrobiales bacterium]|nr:hypothetical protein [Longimicrobiales bacterium]